MQRMVSQDRRSIALWLGLCALMVALMVVVGGYTRLTGSGLSITQWKPVHGILPPMNADQWQEEFSAYKQIPQFSQINPGMNVEDFKAIYWPEYWHRVLGRSVGLVFFLPFTIFLIRRSISGRLAWRLAGIFALGGLQGFIGWYMVSSGLSERPFVSHTRLALHLSTAFLIFALLLWTMLDLLSPWRNTPVSPRCLWGFRLFTALLSAQIILGALLAGLHGGLIYNSFPTMNGDWLPPDLLTSAPGEHWLEHIPLIQFLHRWVAVGVVCSFTGWFIAGFRDLTDNRVKTLSILLFLSLFIQFLLGVLTLLHQVPLPLALKHQFGGLWVFGVSVALLHGLSSRPNGDFSPPA